MSRFLRALLGILPAWRHVGSPELPVWRFLRRRNVLPPRYAALRADVRCELCHAKDACRRLLAKGSDMPAAGCPNAGLFS